VDILSHGLWGAITFGRRTRPSFWLAFVLGLAPDLLSFGILYLAVALGLAERPDFSHGTPPESSIPQYVHHLYNVTHSLMIFLTAFLVVWGIRKRPVWELGAWGLHVLVDVPTHSSSFFPTPVFWPLFSWKFDGWQWMNLAILVPNYVLLSLCYAWFISQSVRAGNSRGPEIAGGRKRQGNLSRQ
jgi:hypothetical protein